MRVPLSWIQEFAPISATASEIADTLIRLGFEVESVEAIGADVRGPLVVGRVDTIEELTEFKKPIRFCEVSVGDAHGGVRGIVCGARNFQKGDFVVVALPGSELPGGFSITARETYGRTSDGMLCSERELGLSDEHTGILVLADNTDIGADAMPLLGIGDSILDVSVNPDRGYAMSVRGLSRELSAAFGVPFSDPADELTHLPEPLAGVTPRGIDVVTDGCSIFVLRGLCGLNAGAASPMWLTRRLRAAGIRPVSLVVDVTNYVMLELGQPLHAFDAQQVRGTVTVRRAEPGEELQLIDHTSRTLTEDDLVIADDERVLSLAGIMGGAQSEISATTTDVLLEAAHFDADIIAASCRRHRVSTDASRRFERGVDPQLAPAAAHRAASLLVRLAGAQSTGLAAKEFEQANVAIATDSEQINTITGLSVTVQQCVAALRAVGCDVAVSESNMTVMPPSWRPDLRLPCDLAEEVARWCGYDQIPTIVPTPTDQTGLTAAQRARRRRDDALVGLGWTQVMLTPFTSRAAVAALGCEADDDRLDLVELINPMSDEEPYLRSTLLPSLAAAIHRNRSRGFESVALFEASAVHHNAGRAMSTLPPDAGTRPTDEQLAQMLAVLPQEHHVVAGVASGAWLERQWQGRDDTWDWRHAIDAAQTVVAAYGCSAAVRADVKAGWHPGRCAAIGLAGASGLTLGWAGELHPRVAEQLGLPPRAIAFELCVDELETRAISSTPTAFGRVLATSPVVKEDVALVVDLHVSASEVADALRDGCGDLLESIALFDEYTGEQVGPGRKSLAFALRFRHPERSLTDDDVAHIRASGVESAARRCGAVLRA